MQSTDFDLFYQMKKGQNNIAETFKALYTKKYEI